MRSILCFLFCILCNFLYASDCKNVFVDKTVNKEIERKFLLIEDFKVFASDRLLDMFDSLSELRSRIDSEGDVIWQGYIPLTALSIVQLKLQQRLPFTPKEMRVRSKANKKHTFTAKGEGFLKRNEFEIEIAQETFEYFWTFTEGARVHKKRLDIKIKDQVFTFDLYKDRELLVAEVEFKTEEEAKHFLALGKDVTEEKRFKNYSLAAGTIID